MKKCSTCNKTKPLIEFNKSSAKHDGLQVICRPCGNAYSKQHYLKNIKARRKQISARRKRVREENRVKLCEYFSNHECKDCGESDILVLEFDHLRDKKANICDLLHYGYSWESILQEIAKCEVVCSNCHRRRTYRRSGSYRVSHLQAAC